ncbi:hypothetical protein OOT00_15180, partial [Desulfobotulus sp. H1]
VVALRFALVNLQNSFGLITSINRFYPQVQRYFLFIKGFKATPSKRELLTDYTLRMHPGLASNDNPENHYRLVPGDRLGVVTPFKLNQYSMYVIASALLGHSEKEFVSAVNAMGLVSGSYSCPDRSIREIFCLPENAGWPDTGLPESFVSSLTEAAGDLDRVIDSEMWNSMAPELRFILTFGSVLNSDAQWIVVDEKIMRKNKMVLELYKSRLKEKILVVIYRINSSKAGRCGEKIIAVTDSTKLLGVGSPEWFKKTKFCFTNGKSASCNKDTDEELEDF